MGEKSAKEGEGLPRHIAIVMDGNGRWAKKRLLPRSAGHRAGMKRMIALTEHIFSRGVRYCTLFALSTENLARPRDELDALFSLFREYFTANAKTLARKGIALKVIGDLSLLPEDVADTVRRGVEDTQNGTTGTLALAIGYGGRQEIVSAVNEAVRRGVPVDEETFSSLLYTNGMPDPDLFIRTGKELRLSNFLLWQSAYAELYFSGKYFPDFTNADLDSAIAAFASRERRYGKL